MLQAHCQYSYRRHASWTSAMRLANAANKQTKHTDHHAHVLACMDVGGELYTRILCQQVSIGVSHYRRIAKMTQSLACDARKRILTLLPGGGLAASAICSGSYMRLCTDAPASPYTSHRSGSAAGAACPGAALPCVLPTWLRVLWLACRPASAVEGAWKASRNSTWSHAHVIYHCVVREAATLCIHMRDNIILLCWSEGHDRNARRCDCLCT